MKKACLASILILLCFSLLSCDLVSFNRPSEETQETLELGEILPCTNGENFEMNVKVQGVETEDKAQISIRIREQGENDYSIYGGGAVDKKYAGKDLFCEIEVLCENGKSIRFVNFAPILDDGTFSFAQEGDISVAKWSPSIKCIEWTLIEVAIAEASK